MAMEPTKRTWWSPIGLALLCAHCAVGAGVAALGAVGLIAAPTIFGVSVHYFWPPAAILGGFALWLWSGRDKPCPT